VPLGSFEELEAQGFRNAGTPNVGGTIVTAGGLVFVGATNDSRFRAFDSRTGKELWMTRLDASGNATPITYLGANGKQYVAIAAGGPAHLRNVGDRSADNADSLMAFALSASGPTTSIPKSPGGQPAAASRANANAVLPEVPGKQLVIRVCSKCHGIATFAASRMTRDQWKDEVEDMVARGAEGTSGEIEAVIDYLARNLSRPRASASPEPRKKPN
jgi:mono/diheme cytochrome c family protein